MSLSSYNISVLLVVVVSYLLGSIPTAYLIGKLHGIDIFAKGSGNMGATNVARTLGIRWAIFVLVFDIIKGIVAIVIARMIMVDSSKAAATTVAAIVVIIGHNWSLFATLFTGTLRGGKGAATAFGTLLMIAPAYVIIGAVFLGGVVVARTRYVSLAVLAAFSLAIGWLMVLTLQQQLESWVIVYSTLIAILLILRFKGNIQRLLDGTERRLGEHL